MVIGLIRPTQAALQHCQEGTRGFVASNPFSSKSEESSLHVLGIETWPEGLPRPGDRGHQISPRLLAAHLALSTSTRNQRNG